MDTRFWGPSGWKLLHLVAQEPIHSKAHASAVLEWFELLEYILPCKYCRASFHDYMRLQPLTATILENTEAFAYWLYEIHNRVNGKLRGQGLLTAPDPQWSEVAQRYRHLHASLCDGVPLLGWDFMTSVAYSTPAKDFKPLPMPDTPEFCNKWDMAKKNRYNLLTTQERLPFLRRWWNLIPSILPCAAWRRAWAHAYKKTGQPPLPRGRDAVMRWMWKIEERVCAGLRCPTPHRSYPALCREVAAFESGCSRQRRGKTCRTLRKRQRQAVRTRRNRKGAAVL
jgi:hypothetical protein